MADHTVTIQPGCVPDPQTVGGSSNPIFTGDTVHFVNLAGVPCELRFSPPSPFGNPTINVPSPGTASPKVTGVVHKQTDFPYTCTAQTVTVSPAAPSGTASLSTGGDPGDGIIIVDPPGTGGPGATVTMAPKTTAKRKATTKPKSKAAGKKKSSSSSSKTRKKAKPKSKGKAKGKSKGKKKH